MLLVQVLSVSPSSASMPPTLRVSVGRMAWAGGVVTLSVSDAHPGATCFVTVTPAVAGGAHRWICGPGVHRVNARLPSNESSAPVRYRFTLAPGNVVAEVYVMPANHGVGLRITDQPTNAAVSTLANSPNMTATLLAQASGSPALAVQWYNSTAPNAWTPVKGATRRSLVVSASTLSGLVVQYVATFTNSQGSVTTRPATVYEVQYGPYWAGYVDASSSARQFSSVSAAWTVPFATCTGTTTIESTWVGLDGSSNSTVEQAGTAETCLGGLPSYDAFYEMWGNAALNDGQWVFLPTASDPVAPGDAVSATVTFANGQWVFTVDDTTAGWSSSTPVAQAIPPPAQSSAEWVVESGQICVNNCVTATLADTTPVTFSHAESTFAGANGSISSWPTQSEAIEDSGHAVDQVSALDPTGSSFTVTYLGASS